MSRLYHRIYNSISIVFRALNLLNMAIVKWSIFLEYDGKPRIITLTNPQSLTVADLKRKIQSETGLPSEHQRLLFAAKEMRDDKSLLTTFAGLGDSSTIHLIQRLPGGAGPRKVEASIVRSKGPCIVSTMTYDKPVCVKMPCGHVVHPDELVELCNNEVFDQHKWAICCFMPGCAKEWPFEYIAKCGPTQTELNLLSKGMSENKCMFDDESDIRKCPKCLCFSERLDRTNTCVRCLSCFNTEGEPFDFCWLCLRQWIGEHKCAVMGDLDILATCPEKNINGVKCPSIRSCPKCGVLIEHKEACKHMTCMRCKQEFCFVCLRVKTSSWQCGGYSENCPVTSRQTTIKRII